MVIAEIRPDEAPAHVVIDVVRRLERGEVLILPTDTVYGIHALARHRQAVLRVKRIKGLEEDRPLSTLYSSVVGLSKFVQLPSGDYRRRIVEAWPGAVTWVLPARPDMPEHLVGEHRTLGIRIPNHQLLRSVCASLDDLVISTSANRHGEPPATRREELDAGLLAEVDGTVIQSEPLPGRPSEVKRWTPAGPEILRSREGITQRADRMNVLVVCTGNICRSPMAEGMLRKRLDEEAPGAFVVRSAGTSARVGMRASLPAVQAMKDYDVDIKNHLSRPVDNELVDWADVILVMTPDQLGEMHFRFPEHSEKTFLLTAYPEMDTEEHKGIPDPIGSGEETYRRVAQMLKPELERIVEHLLMKVK